ncbi:MAG: NYN domain-containing protein [Zoogloea sp.]|nr:NYN domain-containing protein [Zoogloea sp.]
MASSSENVSMALFCDFENVALGVRDANFEKFDIKPILERLLLKGSIVVKKAYCDWERYKGFKATMHEANFELIEIPHVRQSGKNSADIRLVVDALDLCYTKSHVNTFVIISGDSDFSPLVSKLRENNKQVIGVGVKQSTSDLLIANCDEFIFYDDLVREMQRTSAKREPREAQPSARRSPAEEKGRKDEQEGRKTRGIELAVSTFEALMAERGDSGKIWASVLKEAIKRRKPDFSEGRYGFRAFGNLLEEAQARGLLEFGRDEKSGTYVYRSGAASRSESAVMEQAQTVESGVEVASVPAERRPSRRNGRGARKSVVDNVATAQSELEAAYAEHVAQSEFAARDEPLALSSAPIEHVEPIEPAETRRPPRRGRGERKPAVEQLAPVPDAVEAPAVPASPVEAASPPAAKEERRRSRGSRQPKEQAPEAAASDVVAEAAATAPEARTETRRKGRGGRKTADQTTEVVPSESAASGEASAPPASAETAAKPARKPAARSRRPRKTEE